MKKKISLLMVTVGLSVLSCIPAFAGQWKQDNTGWWWQDDDGSYPTSTWRWLDGNNDGIAESYYFGADGYMLTNTTTPDGYTVNADGAWTVNGALQTKQVSSPADSNNQTTSSENEIDREIENLCKIKVTTADEAKFDLNKDGYLTDNEYNEYTVWTYKIAMKKLQKR